MVKSWEKSCSASSRSTSLENNQNGIFSITKAFPQRTLLYQSLTRARGREIRWVELTLAFLFHMKGGEERLRNSSVGHSTGTDPLKTWRFNYKITECFFLNLTTISTVKTKSSFAYGSGASSPRWTAPVFGPLIWALDHNGRECMLEKLLIPWARTQKETMRLAPQSLFRAHL
jgi:hypothetical protein